MRLLVLFVAVFLADRAIAIAIELGKDFFRTSSVFGTGEEFLLADGAIVIGIALLQLMFCRMRFAVFAFAFFFRLNVGAAGDEECE